MDISYDYYKVFYQVAKCKSISAAAEMLQKGQPNLTRIISNLEGQLGCRLFVRSSRGVRLTPEGEKLYQHISLAVRQIQAGEQALLADRGLQTGTVTIASSEIALRCCLLPVLEDFRGQYPGVRVRLSNLSGPQAIRTVLEKQADFAVVTGPLEIPSQLRVRQVGMVQQVAAGGEKFRTGRQTPMTLAEFSALPQVGLRPDTVTFRHLSRFFGQHQIEFKPEIEVATADQLLPIIRSNLAVGFVPEKMLLEEEEIYPLGLTERVPPQQVLLIDPGDGMTGAAAKRLMQMVYFKATPHNSVSTV